VQLFFVLNLELCENVLNKNQKKVKSSDLKLIREWLYFIANIEYSNYQKVKQDEKCTNIHKGLNRRTG
jgi:hypothetical protein